MDARRLSGRKRSPAPLPEPAPRRSRALPSDPGGGTAPRRKRRRVLPLRRHHKWLVEAAAEHQVVIVGSQPGCGKVVLATEVADTAVFVDGIRYVVDSGVRCAERLPDAPPTLAGAAQAARERITGWSRANRKRHVTLNEAITGEKGKYFCLYTREEDESDLVAPHGPEVHTVDADGLPGLVLALRALGIASADMASPGFLAAPPAAALQQAVARLMGLGALDARGELTEAGKRMAVEGAPPVRDGKLGLLEDVLPCQDSSTRILFML